MPPTIQAEALRQKLKPQTEAEALESSLYAFVQAAWSVIEPAPYVDNWHIELICDTLQRVTTGEIPKLRINIPPGCSKSLLVCVFWPCWEWARDPSIRWFFASYDQRLSTRDSVKCRAILESTWFQGLWPGRVQFTDDQNQKTYYETARGGYRLATSVGGHGTGEHPNRVVTDDPHNVRRAESATERQSVADWWGLTMSTRGVSLDARRVIVMQRLHEEDLSGLVSQEEGWATICLPMRFESDHPDRCPEDPRTKDGDLLTPDQFSEVQVKEMERALGPYGTAGQLQQRPSPRSGAFFKVEQIGVLPAPLAPGRVHARMRYWDTASTAGAGDRTAGVLLCRGIDEAYVIEDVVLGQWASEERDAIVRQTAAGDGHAVRVMQQQEPGSGGKDQARAFCKLLSGYSVKTEPATGSKEVRADPFASQVNAGNVRIVAGPWNRAFLDELRMFPAGRHDDQVDAVAAAFNQLVQGVGANFRSVCDDYDDE